MLVEIISHLGAGISLIGLGLLGRQKKTRGYQVLLCIGIFWIVRLILLIFFG